MLHYYYYYYYYFSAFSNECCSPRNLAFATLPLPIPFVAFLKLTASSRPSAPPSDSPKCLRFGHRLTLCTLNIHLLTCLLTYDGLELVQSVAAAGIQKIAKTTQTRGREGCVSGFQFPDRAAPKGL